jgi:phosphate/sulfate permease
VECLCPVGATIGRVSPTSQAAPRKPRWYLIPLRVLLVTFLLTLLGFAVSLLLGIVGVVVGAKLRGGTPNMQIAYRDVAAPVAAAVFAIVLVSSLFMEIRNYRQAKALAEIESLSH